MLSIGVNGEGWYVLGFSADDVIATWQDARLAEECLRAWRQAGEPPCFRILQAAGEGDSFVYWFVCGSAAQVLDAGRVDWRRFVVGFRTAPPQRAHPVLRGERV